MRQTIRAALSSAASYDEFSAVLFAAGRDRQRRAGGRLSYLTPDRTKPITARKLGDDFDCTAVLALLEQNAHRTAEQTAAIPEYPRSIKERLQGKKLSKPPRKRTVFSVWLTGRQNERREKAWDMTAGRQSTI